MIKINLLAEKQVSRARTQRVKLEGPLNIQVFLLVGALALSLLYVGWRWRTLAAESARLSAETQKAQAEEQRLKAVNARGDELNKKRDELQAKVDLITKLKNNQTGPVHMLDQISRSLPDFLWLEAINESGNALSITGKATTYNAVSNFYNNLTQSEFFSDVVLGTTLEVGEGVSFSLNCKFVPPAVRQAQQGQPPPAGAGGAPEGT
jgi:type IV pilus assembly protein PilN